MLLSPLGLRDNFFCPWLAPGRMRQEKGGYLKEMPNTLRGITFDAYGTLVQLENPFELLWEALKRRGFDIPLEVIKDAFFQEMIYYRANHMDGKDTESLYILRKRCASLLFDSLRHRGYECCLKADELVTVLMESIRFKPFAEASSVLSWCYSRKIKTAVVSNWDCSLPGIINGLYPGNNFQAILVSAIEGFDKSGPELFVRASEELDVPAKGILHVGDDPEHDVASPLKAGCKAVLIERDDSRAEGLSKEKIRSLTELPDIANRLFSIL